MRGQPASALEPAYVLHRRPYRDSSLLLEALTAHNGRLGLVARGVRSGRGGARVGQYEPFRPLLISYAGQGDLVSLRGAEAAGRPLALRGEASLAGLYANELLLRLTRRQDPHPGLFVAYSELLPALAAASGAGELAWALRRFEFRLLEDIGYGLQGDGEDGGAYDYRPDEGLVRSAPGAPGADRIDAACLGALQRSQCPGPGCLEQLRRLSRLALGRALGGQRLHTLDLLRAMHRQGRP